MESSDVTSRDTFLRKIQQLKDNNMLTPGKIAEIDPSQKLNIVFDIDHTLIIAI